MAVCKQAGSLFDTQLMAGNQGHKKGEGCFSFTFIRREISPAKDEQHSCCIYYDSKLETNNKKQ